MSFSCLVDKTNIPADQVVFALLGEAVEAWKEVGDYLFNEKKARPAYKFYGKNYGWALRFQKSGKSIVALYPNENDFYLQIILNQRQEQWVLDRIKNEELARVISSTPRAYEGKWVFIRYSQIQQIEDIKSLIDIRLSKG